jgi:AraC family transcriptional regulator
MNWSGKVLLWEEYGLFLGAAGTADLHESPAIKICISLENNFGLRISDADNWKNYSAAIIPAGLQHAIEGRGNRMAMFLLAPEGSLGRRLISATQENEITQIPAVILQKIISLLSVFDDIEKDENIYAGAYMKIISSIDSNTAAIDPRVSQSIEWIRAGRDSGILVKDIAAEVDLSESRFSHLFTENVRVPVRRYLLWLRLRDALHMLAAVGGSLTETAHSAGFADSAHLTRTFRTSLGIAPSALVKDSELVSFLK